MVSFPADAGHPSFPSAESRARRWIPAFAGNDGGGAARHCQSLPPPTEPRAIQKNRPPQSSLLLGDVRVEELLQPIERGEALVVRLDAGTGYFVADGSNGHRVHKRHERRLVDQHVL